MKNYFVEGAGGWFVVSAANKRRARSFAVSEFGRGGVREVRVATESETESYKAQRGAVAEDE
jgi:hypothetical protein